MTDYDEGKEKLTWSERDKLKDKSNHVSRDKSEYQKKSSAKEEWAKKQYLKEAEKIFSGEEEKTEEEKKAMQKISDHYGKNTFNSTVGKFIKKYGIPNSWETLMLILDYKDQRIVEKALNALRGLMAESSAAEREGFKSRVKILAMTAENDELQELAQEIADELE
jgi:hypothetical protein